MGVYIKGMEMPKNCEECQCSYWTEGVHHDYCQAVGYDTEIHYGEKDRPQWCPLIEVPEPHGDLIDASEKIRVQMYDDEHEDFHTVEMTIDDLLSQSWVKAYAYPIIPASESKERPAFLPTYELTPRREEAE